MTARRRDDELLTLSDAADRFGLARSTVRRALDAGRFPNAVQDDDPRGAWRVPLQDLLDAGYRLPDASTTPQDAPVAPQSTPQGATGDAPVAPQVTPQDDGPTTTLVPWADVAHLVDRLADQQDARATAEKDAEVATFRREQAERERDRLAEQAAQAERERARLADELQAARQALADTERDRDARQAALDAALAARTELEQRRRRWGRGKRE